MPDPKQKQKQKRSCTGWVYPSDMDGLVMIDKCTGSLESSPEAWPITVCGLSFELRVNGSIFVKDPIIRMTRIVTSFVENASGVDSGASLPHFTIEVNVKRNTPPRAGHGRKAV